jgi:hypothetical protein
VGFSNLAVLYSGHFYRDPQCGLIDNHYLGLSALEEFSGFSECAHQYTDPVCFPARGRKFSHFGNDSESFAYFNGNANPEFSFFAQSLCASQWHDSAHCKWTAAQWESEFEFFRD